MDKRNSHISTFSGGMDRDTNFVNLPKDKYYELKNGRVIVNNYSNSFSVTPFKQPELLTLTGDSLNTLDWIIGSILVRNGEDFELVLFTTRNHDAGVTNLDRIWLVTGIHGTVVVIKKCEGTFGFDPNYLIEGVSKYESSNNIKIYWWDNLNSFRFCNIATLTAVTLALTSVQFENVPDATMEQPKFVGLGVGNFKSGKVQYCYKLYNNTGAITNTSPLSGMINLTKYDEDGINFLGVPNMSYGYMGTANETTLTENTGKAVTMLFDNLDSRFHKIKVYSIYYSVYGTTPVVKLIADTNFTGTVYQLTDTNSLPLSTTVTLEDITLESGIVKPKTGVSKYNTLYLGNIHKDNFIVNLDFRAYRFNSNSTTFRLNGTTDYVNTFVVPPTDNAIQVKSDQYRTASAYQKSSTILGGEGLNIKYEFYIYQDFLDNVTPIDGSMAAQLVGMPEVFSTSSIGMSSINSDQNSNNFPTNKSFTDYNSPQISYMNGGYCRDEVYPFAIVFRNNKGQKSFPIWIADIKMPAGWETDGKTTYSTPNVIPADPKTDYNITVYDRDNRLYYNALGIKFTIKSSIVYTLTGLGITSWEIVRMHRKVEDKSILAQGLTVGCRDSNIGGTHRLIFGHNSFTYGNNVHKYIPLEEGLVRYGFISPEYYFDSEKKNINWKSGDKIEVAYTMTTSESYHADSVGYFTSRQLGYRTFNDSGTNKHVVTLFKEILGKEFPDFDGILMCPYFTDLPYSSNSYHNYKGSLLAIKTQETIGVYNNPVISNYTRDVTTTAYGGNTYSSRFNREYFSTTNTSLLTNSGDQTLVVFGGDTYITMFDHLYMQPGYLYQPDSNTYGEEVAGQRKVGTFHFPVESTYNTNFRHGCFISKREGNNLPIYDAKYSALGSSIETFQEKAGAYQCGDVSSGDSWSTYITTLTKDYYVYNTVYSQYPLLPSYIPLPEDFSNTAQYDARVIWSETKVTGESIDSWLQFPNLNYKDLDYEHGPINRLHKFKDNVFSFQTKGFSMLSINPRTALSVQDGLPIQIGSGSKLERYDYVSTKYGCYHRFGVTDTENGLYFIDGFNKKLMMYSGQAIPLSDIKGMYSYINKEISQNILYTDLGFSGSISLHYDQINNDVIFSLQNTSPYVSNHILFNEILKSYVSINDLYKYDSGTGNDVLTGKFLFIPTDKELFISFANNELYKYDSKLSKDVKTELSVVINSDYAVRKVFDNLYFDIDIYDDLSNKDINYVQTNYSITLDTTPTTTVISHTTPSILSLYIPTIQFYNDWQNTGSIVPKLRTAITDIVDTSFNISKVEREYMFKIPGNDVINPADSILDPNNLYIGNQTYPNITKPTFRDRMRGKYVICKITMKPFKENYPDSNAKIKTFALNYLNTLFRLSY